MTSSDSIYKPPAKRFKFVFESDKIVSQWQKSNEVSNCYMRGTTGHLPSNVKIASQFVDCSSIFKENKLSFDDFGKVQVKSMDRPKLVENPTEKKPEVQARFGRSTNNTKVQNSLQKKVQKLQIGGKVLQKVSSYLEMLGEPVKLQSLEGGQSWESTKCETTKSTKPSTRNGGGPVMTSTGVESRIKLYDDLEVKSYENVGKKNEVQVQLGVCD